LILIIADVIKKFPENDQKNLLKSIFLTGGVSQMKGFKERIS